MPANPAYVRGELPPMCTCGRRDVRTTLLDLLEHISVVLDVLQRRIVGQLRQQAFDILFGIGGRGHRHFHEMVIVDSTGDIADLLRVQMTSSDSGSQGDSAVAETEAAGLRLRCWPSAVANPGVVT